MNFVWLKITKKYRNGEKTVNIPLLKSEVDAYGKDSSYLEEKAQDWAETDANGQVYGYTLEWEEQTDKEVIKKEIQMNIDRTKVSVNNLINSSILLEADLKHFSL